MSRTPGYMYGPLSQPQFPSLTSNAQGWLLRRTTESGISFFSKCPGARESLGSTDSTAVCC